MHNPVNAANLHAARHRMAFEELFLLQLKLLLRREVDRAPRDAQDAKGIGIRQLDMMHAGSDALGFTLTPAQDRVLKEVPTSPLPCCTGHDACWLRRPGLHTHACTGQSPKRGAYLSLTLLYWT